MPYIPVGDVVEVLGVNTLEMYKDRHFNCMYKSSKGSSMCQSILLRQYSPLEYYCAYHFNRKKNSEITKSIQNSLCEYVFVKGAQKGLKCGRISKEVGMFCTKHHKPKPKELDGPIV
jgi:hypothetical protein